MTQERASGGLPEGHPLHAPGLKRRPRKDGEALYWIPPQKDVAAGYGLKSITIPAGGTETEIAAICRKHQTDLLAWRAGIVRGPATGTWGWAVRRYRNDAESPYQRVQDDTRELYDYACRIIETVLGEREIRTTTGADLARWYDGFKAPAKAGREPRVVRARAIMGQIRRLLKHALFVGHRPAAAVLELYEMGAITFRTGGAREAAPTPEQAIAIARKALEMGFRSIAISTLAQFELTERRVSIIGKWSGKGDARRWTPGWVWQDISPDWTVVYYQNKRGRRRREFDLNDTPLLLELLAETPLDARVGPVIVSEITGKPWERYAYAKRFRAIASAAGVPEGIWSMDMRAGGATEADALPGLTMKDLKAAGGWSTEQMASRYSRGGIRAAQNVVKLRQKARQGD